MGIGPQALGSMGMSKSSKPCGSPLTKRDTCWDGYKAQGKKKSPSGKKTASGRTKMVNNCVKV